MSRIRSVEGAARYEGRLPGSDPKGAPGSALVQELLAGVGIPVVPFPLTPAHYERVRLLHQTAELHPVAVQVLPQRSQELRPITQ